MTWEEFVRENHATEIEFKAIYYGLKEQKILQNFLTAYSGMNKVSYARDTICDCLSWIGTEEGYNFWEHHDAIFLKNYSEYLDKVIKRPSLFRDRIKEPKCGTE